MEGGALFTREQNGKDAAIAHFLDNCSFTTLTNSSISAITIKCNINPGIESKLLTVHSDGAQGKPVNTLLLKIMPSIPHGAGGVGDEEPLTKKHDTANIRLISSLI